MRIQVISATVENIPTAKGGYNKVVVTYKNLENNKIEVKQVMDFAQQAVFGRLSEAKPNEVLSIKNEKVFNDRDKKDYWTWTEVSRDDGTAPEVGVGSGPNPAPTKVSNGTGPVRTTNTYETPEERAEKQRLIVKQSSLAQAIEFHKDQGQKPTVDDVLELAQRFNDWVYNKGVAGLTDDVPF